MTGFSKTEAKENGYKVTVEIKSLNGRYLEINTRLPRSLSHKELEIRELIKSQLDRGTVSVNVNVESAETEKNFVINEDAASECFKSLLNLKKKLKIKDDIKMEHLLVFSEQFNQKTSEDNGSELEWKLVQKAIRDGLKNLNISRRREGQNLEKDLQTRMKNISIVLDKIEKLGINKIPEERERLRQRVAQLFESDEIDEHRIQMEFVLLADKLDISEECLRLRSHLKFFFDTLKSKEANGRKLNFIMQEIHREVNTIGSKANDVDISQMTVNVKDELERIREQVQNIE